MRGWTSSALGWLARCALALSLCARGAAAQESLFERLGLDRLQLRAIGVAFGPVKPKSVNRTESYAIQADYGEIARHWRVVFVAGYWGSHFTDETVNEFVERLRRSITDPAGDDTIVADRVRVSDISLEADARWSPTDPSTFVRPYAGVGIGAHIVNAESTLIRGTFVESALDEIATGLTGTAGVDLVPSRRLSLGLEGRYTLLSNVRFATVRATASYRFSLTPPTRAR